MTTAITVASGRGEPRAPFDAAQSGADGSEQNVELPLLARARVANPVDDVPVIRVGRIRVGRILVEEAWCYRRVRALGEHGTNERR